MDGIELTTQIMDRPKILTISSDEILLNDIKEYLEEQYNALIHKQN